MSISAWSTTGLSNSNVLGYDIGENCNPGNLNNMGRDIMAAVREWYDTVQAYITANNADITAIEAVTQDPLVASLAAQTLAANQILYGSGANTFAVTALSAFMRSALASADAAAAATALGVPAAAAFALSGNGGSGKLTIPVAGGSTFAVTWRDYTLGHGNGSLNYGSNHNYTSFAKAWINGDDVSNDVSVVVTGSGLGSATYNNSGSGANCTLFAIGV